MSTANARASSHIGYSSTSSKKRFWTRGSTVGVGAKQVSGHKKQSPLNDSFDEDVKAFLLDDEKLHTHDDLTQVNPVTIKTVLKCLQARYLENKFYTNAGCTLVAVNPFKPVPSLYTLKLMMEYHKAPQLQYLRPHIFTSAEQAYRNVQSQMEPINQSLIVSGESGAGKTWTSRCLMKFYATVAVSSSLKAHDTVERIERRVLDSNPVMEAFGNACTLWNNNSSRFGKYIQLQLNRSQQLVGASIQTYLLEKTRVTNQPVNERNFHIFYQITKGATEDERLKWNLPCNSLFTWLPNTERTLEEDCFEVTKQAMLHLGISSETQNQIFKILSGLLHLGNVEFVSPDDECMQCELSEHSKDFLQIAAGLLKISEDHLLSQLRIRVIRAGRQQQVFKKPCLKSECIIRRDCLAKVIYAKIFDWLVSVINRRICADPSMWNSFIGLLDVYGFESFPVNNLEQLCINYANEKLQQHFVAHYLKAQQEEYEAEGLKWSFVSYQDNQKCLDLIEGNPVSIFSLLNEECRLNRLSDAKQFMARVEKALAVNECLSLDKFTKTPHFIVSHYASSVCYQTEGMTEKNKDPIPPELLHLMEQSKDSLLQNLFAAEEKINDTRQSKSLTVVSRFKSSLENLMNVLHSTTPQYIRCIKPNAECQPVKFKKDEVITQLEACGIVETISISAAGFPIRIPYLSFIERYGVIGKKHLSSRLTAIGCSPTKKRRVEDHVKNAEDVPCEAVQAILMTVLSSKGLNLSSCDQAGSHRLLVHCGKTKVFMTHLMLELLENARTQLLSQKAFCIQCSWRRYQKRQRKRHNQAATRIQAAIRSWLRRRRKLKQDQAARAIQRAWRRWRTAMDALAAAELDDTVVEESRCESLHGSSAQGVTENFMEPLEGATLSHKAADFWSWPFRLILPSAPTLSVTIKASGLQRLGSVFTALQLKFGISNYKVETNQFDEGVASIRARPQVAIKFHLGQSPLLHAHTSPERSDHGLVGLNQILLDK
ncbi:unconventional myosin-XIX [Polypterus senegalus]|uniref:unconventional myosin-XIX n=1 Tax=Polypterus senegalus TaxID=55291 RepID=UPI0019632FE2|nr:unconventional myosin-XIX [Polypterus senegalus]